MVVSIIQGESHCELQNEKLATEFAIQLGTGAPPFILVWQDQDTQSIPEIIWVKNVRAIVICGFLMKYSKKHMLKI